MRTVVASQLGLWALALVPFGVVLADNRPQDSKLTFYEGAVQTTLKAHCGSCHSGDDKSADLDTTTLKGLLKGGFHGSAVVSGKPDESLLVLRLEGKGGKAQMPLGFKPLAPEKISLIRKWIADGCRSNGGKQTHWAYKPPVLPAVPRVQESKWPQNAIDNFVLAKLQSQGLEHSQVAPKETLIRRLSLDIIGLPPTIAEVRAFVQDQRPDAYERVVDRLLASNHFGERMARPWLDLARYADSDGYEKDLNRTAWKYRDWVINAFNSNQPFDQFTIDQIAGDMVPQATRDQLIATGFHRNSMFNSEGGVDPEEAQFNLVIDRINTTSTVWLGSTIQCARCHDHKYDPFTQKDFYKLYAALGNTEIIRVGDYKIGEEKWHEPEIQVPSPEQQSKLNELNQKMESLKASLAKPNATVLAEFERWLKNPESPWIPLKASQAQSHSGQSLTPMNDGSWLAAGPVPANDTYTIELESPTKEVTGISLEAMPDSSMPAYGPGRSVNGNFILTKVDILSSGRPVALKRASASYSQPGYDPQSVVGGDPHKGWAISGAYGETSELLVELDKALRPSGNFQVRLTFGSPDWPQHVIGRFRLSAMTQENPAVLTREARVILKKTRIGQNDKSKLFSEFQKFNPETRAIVADQERCKADIAQILTLVPTAMVVKEKPIHGAIKSNIHIRGEFLQKGDEVVSGPPECLDPRPGPAPFNRLALARWLVTRENPLTARVEVNRLWEMVFGRGLVETSEDFGSQGSPPSHPELLDWLAVTFMDSKWNVKALIKQMVMSATYRQSSHANPTALERDPQNVYLSRAPRYRMEAEAVRDNMLAIGGILNSKIGGPSVYPSQPSAVWDTPYNGEQWMTSQGADRFRRGLYTFWKRSSPYPSFLTLDATSRETCTVRRSRTNTPLQALALLNDEVTMDSAKGLAKRMMNEGGSDVQEQLQFAFEVCTCRRPEQAEVQALTTLYRRLLETYKSKPVAMKKLANNPREAAYVMVANTLLNLDETMTRN